MEQSLEQLQCPKCGGLEFSDPNVCYVGKDIEWSGIRYKTFALLAKCKCGVPVPLPDGYLTGSMPDCLPEHTSIRDASKRVNLPLIGKNPNLSQ